MTARLTPSRPQGATAMDIADLVAPDQVRSGLRVGDKAQLLKELGRRAAAALGIDAAAVLDALAAREALGSTGIGAGVAMPHARLAGVKRVYGFLARLDPPIDFAAIDDRKVDLVFLLITPEAAGNEHLAALACAARALRDPRRAARLRAATDDAELYRLLAGAGASPPAKSPP